MCVLCFGVVVCCDVSFMCGVGAGVGVQCVVCDVCGVCVCVVCGVCAVCVCVARLGTRKTPVYRFKTSPCVHRQIARMCSTCARFARSQGGFLNLHTASLSISLLSSFLSSFLPFLFLRSLPSYFSRSLSLLSSLLSSLSSTMTMITRQVGSLSVNTALTCLCQSAWAVAHSMLAEHIRIMQETIVLA